MATFSVSYVAGDHVASKEYCCSICEEQNIQIDAVFYCKKCNKFFCGPCNNSHRQHGWLVFKQSPFGKDKIMKWPLSKKMEKSLMTCDLHKDETITMYCQDHSQLCCSRCVKQYHRLCLKVTPLHQATLGKSTDFKKLSVRMEYTLSQMKQFQTYQEDRVKPLKDSYNEHEKLIVDGMRLNIISFLLQCESSNVYKTHEHMQYTVNEMREKIKYFLGDFEKSTVKEKKEELTLMLAPLMSVRNSCIRLHYELFHLHVAIQKVLGRLELSFIASIKCQAKLQQSETFLNENFYNRVLAVQGKSVYYVRIPSDSYTCWIIAICVLPDGQVLVADGDNNTVKLLDQQYQVVSHCGVAGPYDICMITPSEVAVTVDDSWDNTHEVQLITVTHNQLVPGRKFKLQHPCRGIAHHQGDLFITSGTALYKYSLSGKLVCMLYHDGSRTGTMTVCRCAVSPTGDRLYIINWDQNSLLTLARDGTFLAILKDLDLRGPSDLHVTPAGQVLVCGYASHTIVQVDREGTRKLATLTTEDDGVLWPLSVCYSSITSSIIVGQWEDNILVFRVE